MPLKRVRTEVESFYTRDVYVLRQDPTDTGGLPKYVLLLPNSCFSMTVTPQLATRFTKGDALHVRSMVPYADPSLDLKLVRRAPRRHG